MPRVRGRAGWPAGHSAGGLPKSYQCRQEKSQGSKCLPDNKLQSCFFSPCKVEVAFFSFCRACIRAVQGQFGPWLLQGVPRRVAAKLLKSELSPFISHQVTATQFSEGNLFFPFFSMTWWYLNLHRFPPQLQLSVTFTCCFFLLCFSLLPVWKGRYVPKVVFPGDQGLFPHQKLQKWWRNGSKLPWAQQSENYDYFPNSWGRRVSRMAALDLGLFLGLGRQFLKGRRVQEGRISFKRETLKVQSRPSPCARRWASGEDWPGWATRVLWSYRGRKLEGPKPN